MTSSALSTSTSRSLRGDINLLTTYGIEDDDDNSGSLINCDVCQKPGDTSEENYHNDPKSGKFKLGTDPDMQIYHHLPHKICKDGWRESAIENGSCSICTGKAAISSLNGRRISEIRREGAEVEKKDDTSS